MGKAQQKRTTMILRPRKFISSFSTRYDKQRADSLHFPTTQSELSTWSGVNDFAPPDNKPFARIQRRKEKAKRSKLHGLVMCRYSADKYEGQCTGPNSTG